MSETGYADLHMHTNHSDGWPTPRALVDFVLNRTALQVIAVTDHDTIEGGLRALEHATKAGGDLEVIVGEEVSSRDGHILGLFLNRRVKPGRSAAATVDDIHQQGGLAVAAHPFWRTERQSSRGRLVHGTGWLAIKVDFDAIEVENATPGFYLFNQMAHQLRQSTGRAGIGSSDAHIVDAIGRAYTAYPGRGSADLRQAIVEGNTQACRLRYRAMGLARYAAWGIDQRWQRRLAAEAGVKAASR